MMHYVSMIYYIFNARPTTEIYTLSLHDALPICEAILQGKSLKQLRVRGALHRLDTHAALHSNRRSEEHTSELQSLRHLVCRLLLEKKKQIKPNNDYKCINNDCKINYITLLRQEL